MRDLGEVDEALVILERALAGAISQDTQYTIRARALLAAVQY